MTGKNVGDLLNQRGLTWGWFAGCCPRAASGLDEFFRWHRGGASGTRGL
jgi:hypothetical protein